LPQSKEQLKEILIEKLLSFGIYKKGNYQLFELPLQELQDEFNKYDEAINSEGKYEK
jgi:hypothetical protein